MILNPDQHPVGTRYISLSHNGVLTESWVQEWAPSFGFLKVNGQWIERDRVVAIEILPPPPVVVEELRVL